MENRSGVLLASGGLDSTTLAFWLDRENIDFIPLFINFGQHCAGTELETLKRVLPKIHLERLEIIDVSSIYKKSTSRFIRPANLWQDQITAEDLYIPYRNLLILSIAASFAQTMGVSNVYSAFINSNHAKEIDCSNAFFNKLEEVLREFGSVKINMPFRYFSKFDVLNLGIKLNVPVAETFSCQASPIIPCGACPNCVDRLDAFSQLQQMS